MQFSISIKKLSLMCFDEIALSSIDALGNCSLLQVLLNLVLKYIDFTFKNLASNKLN